MSDIEFSRVWAMPSADTFDVPPIAGFVQKYLIKSRISVDPFARNKRWATHTNDLNPNTAADSHCFALDFLMSLNAIGVRPDLMIFDPPYSLRQVKECYEGVGKEFLMQDSQNAIRWTKERDLIAHMMRAGDDSVVLSFGWNSSGMGDKRGFRTEAILLVTHGPAHNDTICMAERRKPEEAELWQ